MKILPNIIELIGLVLLGYGLFLFCPLIAYAVCGAILLLYGLLLDYMVVPKTNIPTGRNR